MLGKYVNIENINGTSYMVNFNLDIPVKDIPVFIDRLVRDSELYFSIKDYRNRDGEIYRKTYTDYSDLPAKRGHYKKYNDDINEECKAKCGMDKGRH